MKKNQLIFANTKKHYKRLQKTRKFLHVHITLLILNLPTDRYLLLKMNSFVYLDEGGGFKSRLQNAGLLFSQNNHFFANQECTYSYGR